MPEKNITFEIQEHLGVITRFESGWNRELNVISWNGGPAKYDLRDWDEYHERMRKGLTLFEDEMRKLVSMYLNYNNQRAVEKGRTLEAQRRSRFQEQMQQRKQESETSRTEQELYEEAQPPRQEPAEGADLPLLQTDGPQPSREPAQNPEAGTAEERAPEAETAEQSESAETMDTETEVAKTEDAETEEQAQALQPPF